MLNSAAIIMAIRAGEVSAITISSNRGCAEYFEDFIIADGKGGFVHEVHEFEIHNGSVNGKLAKQETWTTDETVKFMHCKLALANNGHGKNIEIDVTYNFSGKVINKAMEAIEENTNIMRRVVQKLDLIARSVH